MEYEEMRRRKKVKDNEKWITEVEEDKMMKKIRNEVRFGK